MPKTILYSEVPEYLRRGDYYKSIENDEDNVRILIGKVYPPPNETVKTMQDFKNMYYTYDQWIVKPSMEFMKFQEENYIQTIIFLSHEAGLRGDIGLAGELLNRILSFKFDIDIDFPNENEVHLEFLLSNNGGSSSMMEKINGSLEDIIFDLRKIISAIEELKDNKGEKSIFYNKSGFKLFVRNKHGNPKLYIDDGKDHSIEISLNKYTTKKVINEFKYILKAIIDFKNEVEED